jgi:hypothetical protein
MACRSLSFKPRNGVGVLALIFFLPPATIVLRRRLLQQSQYPRPEQRMGAVAQRKFTDTFKSISAPGSCGQSQISFRERPKGGFDILSRSPI